MALKKCFLLFLGDKSTNHINAIKKSMDSYFGYNIDGFRFINFENNNTFYEDVEKELDNLKSKDIEPIIMKGFNIHTEDYIRAIIKYYKRDHKDQKFLLTHCAVFDKFILSDAALLTTYNKENIYSLIMNALTLAENLNKAGKFDVNTLNKVALLNAGGSTNLGTASQEWQDIYKTLVTYNKLNKDYNRTFDLEMEQFDVCVDAGIRSDKTGKSLYSIDLPTIIIPSSINEGNSIWKSLTVFGNKSLAGIVVGIPMFIGLTSRTDSSDTIEKTITYLLELLYRKGNI